jgi:hypothetical protein
MYFDTFQLKGLHSKIEAYRLRSGCHWDNDRGANIEGTAAGAEWAQYLKEKGQVCFFLLYSRLLSCSHLHFEGNHVMKPFRNAGWEYLPLFQEMYPGAAKRGGASFHPAIAQASSSQQVGKDSVGNNPDRPDNDPDLLSPIEDNEVIITPPPSTRAVAKRKFGEPSLNAVSTIPSHPSQSQHSLTSSSADNSRPSKRSQHSLVSSSADSSRPSKRSHYSSGIDSEAVAQPSSKPRAARITPATAVIGMQGSINRLTDILQSAMAPAAAPAAPAPTPTPAPAPTPATEAENAMRKALEKLQTVDDGLTREEKVTLVDLISESEKFTSTFLNLTDPVLRQDWLRKVLSKRIAHTGGAGEGVSMQ